MSKTILIAEDQEEILELLSAVFTDSGDYKILCARDGKEAISMACGHNPDIILLDVQLPKINGYDVCNSVKSNPSLFHTKVLMLSGMVQNPDLQEAGKVGADGYITKPFNSIALVEKVEELLDRS